MAADADEEADAGGGGVEMQSAADADVTEAPKEDGLGFLSLPSFFVKSLLSLIRANSASPPLPKWRDPSLFIFVMLRRIIKICKRGGGGGFW